MSPRVSLGAAGLVALVALAAGANRGYAGGGAAASEGIVTVIGPAGTDTLQTLTPTFAVQTSAFPDDDRPFQVGLQISLSPSFDGTPIVDTIADGDAATFTLRHPLPELAQIYWRGFAATATGRVYSGVVGPRQVPVWLRLVRPNQPNGQTVETRRPTFVWSSPSVASPPGPWVYDVEIIKSATGLPELRVVGLLDTTYTPSTNLEANTSYRWRVRARLATGETTSASSFASFVIVDATEPLTTLLFQNFPNPFPTATSSTTCVWFDLAQAGAVRLDVFDLRGNLVRSLVPSREVGGVLPAGRYGRSGQGGLASGCDARFAWDGSTDDGRLVTPGVYLLRLRADGVESIRKILFRGR